MKGGLVPTETLCDLVLEQKSAELKQELDSSKQEHEVQLRLARQVQQKFYRPAPSIPGYDLAAAAYPAEETGGDYFDFIPLPHNHLGIAVGDVEGHGFGSALVMALTRAYVRCFAELGMGVEQVLTQVNRMLINDLGDRCLVTMILASLDISGRSLTYAGAGHVPGYLLDASGDVVHILESGGMPLGLFPHARYLRDGSLTIHPLQTVVLLTDGIAESTNPGRGEFGQDGVLNYLRCHRDNTARELVEGLYQAAREFSAYQLQKDDITAVIAKVKP